MEQVTETTEIRLDPEKQKRAKQYAMINRRLMVVDLVFSGVYFVAWLIFGWSEKLKIWLLRFTDQQWILLILFLLVIGGIMFVINLPLSYYQGYILPHRFDLTEQKLKGWILDEVKGLMVGGVIGLIIIEIIYMVLRAYPTTWWLWAALILLIFNVLLANLAPTIIMPLFNKYVPLGQDHAELAERMIKLAGRANTQVRGVYQFDMSKQTKQANAALTGFGNTRRIIIGDTMIKEFSIDEIETVMAHELGHQMHKDIPLGIIFGSVITLLGLFITSVGLNWGVKVLGFESVSDVAAFPLFLIFMGIFGLVTMPLQNGFSRWREKRADEYALQLTHNGKAYASALKRLANQNLSDADPEPWVEWLLYSHPALGKRIAMAEKEVDLAGAG